jgi:hypothetical protein
LGFVGIAAAWHCGASQPGDANRTAIAAEQPPSVLPATAASDDPPVPLAGDTVQAFASRTGEWQSKSLREVEPEGEFLFQGKLFRLSGKAGLIEWVTSVDVSKLADADRTFQPGSYRDPEGTDVVYVVGTNARHVLLGAIQPGQRFAFQGRLFEAKADPSGGGLLIQNTGNTLNRVAQTFKRKTDTLVDLTVRYEATGKDGVITGTPEHLFFVPAEHDYVRLGKLRSGTQLRTSDGSQAVVLASNTRHGDFEVFNLEVENAHNYFVSPSGGGPGVLVHNDCTLKTSRLRTALKKISSWSRDDRPNTQITGRFTSEEAEQLGKNFVGPNYREFEYKGESGLMSEDGLRQWRPPMQKDGIDPRTGQPRSRTGVQSNFQCRQQPTGPWTNNVHIDVEN